MSIIDELNEKLARDEANLARVSESTNYSQGYIDHLKARVQFDKKMIAAAKEKMGHE